MQVIKATRKVYMSILTVMLVCLTVVATTFAWVGIFTYNQTSPFDLNLKTQDLESDYYLSISDTGEENTFTDSTNPNHLKEQILKNMGKDLSIIKYDKFENTEQYYSTVSSLFDKIELTPVTVKKDEVIQEKFYALDKVAKNVISNTVSKSYFKFDLYLSIEARNEGSITSDVTNKIDVIISGIEDMLKGSSKNYRVSNDFYYPSVNLQYPVNIPNYSIKTSQEISIDTASSTRLAIAVYNPIKRTEDYQSTDEPNKLLIYQGGTSTPTYDKSSNTYSFGGILPEEYNLALQEHKKQYAIGDDKLIVPTELIERGDLELIDDNKYLVNSDFGFGIVNGEKMKMKLTVFFWYEGWDSDCFEIINGQNVKINLVFATGDSKKNDN